MPKPWEKYASQGNGPWAKYGGAATGQPASTKDRLDAALAELEKIQPSTAPKTQPTAPSFGQRLLGAGETALTLGTGSVAAPIGQVAGVARSLLGGHYGTQQGVQEGQQEAQRISDALTYQPRTRAGQRMVGGIGHAVGASGIEALGPMAAELSAPLGATSRAAVQVGRRVAGAPLTAARAVTRVPSAVKGAIRTATGADVPAARLSAAQASKTAVKAAASGVVQRARALDSVRQALETKLQLSQRVPPDLHTQGTTIRSAFTGAMDAAKTARSAEADKLFAASKAEAAAKEASGKRVDTTAAENALSGMIDKAQGIPDLEAGLKKMLSAIKGRPESDAPAILGPTGVPLKSTTPTGKTFDQLELTRRYLNDIGYGSDLEGYPAILRKEARDAAKKIDEAMQNFSPAFAKYKEQYAKMSEPLNSMGTKFGRAVTGTEGGLQEDAYAKVAASDLPSRLFAKKDGIALLTDALAGGKNATKAARDAAQKQVDTMVENWILEQSRGKKPSAALEGLSAPGMRSALTGAPAVESKLRAQFGQQAGYERTLAEMAKAGKTPPMSAETATKMRDKLQQADTLLAQKSATSKQQALKLYEESLASARNARLIPADKYKAALGLIERANTLEEKAMRARKIAKWFGYGAAFTVGAEGARHL